MIEFKTIRYKNFLSSGNQFTEINFQESNTALIVGANGAGKSTVLDALTFSLFGKPFRKVNKGQLVNSINERDTKVEIEFNAKGSPYKVIRGIKPNVFEVYRDGKKMNEDASANDQQKMLESSILRLNYKSFTQVVILGSASFVPFMQLSTAHRREVIEDLLDIKVFSSMSDIMKQKIKTSKESLKVLQLKKESAADKILMQQQFIKSIEKTGQDEIERKQKKIIEIEERSDGNEKRIEDLIAAVKERETDLQQYTTSGDNLKKLQSFKGKIQNKKQNSSEEKEFFDNNTVCPTCTQDIEESFRIDKIGQLQQVLSKHQEGLLEIEKAISDEEERERKFLELQKEITTLQNETSQLNIQVSESNKLRKSIESEIQDITYKLENRTAEDDKLTEFKNNLKQILNDLEKTKEDNDYQLQTNSLLKDDGVKSSIIKKYLPIINKRVNYYLQKMDFYINFTLDEEFNEKIVSPVHDKFVYESFSEGEKMRIDLALLFTWREIARMKNSANTNLLILDEIFDSSLDGFGTEYFTKIIKYVVSDANVFVISHKTEDLIDSFDRVIRFEKTKGFSKKL